MVNSRSYVEKNDKIILYGLGGLIVIAVIAVLFFINFRNKSAAADTLLGKAQTEYQNLNYIKAEAFLKQLSEEYPGTESGREGQFLLANIYFQQKKYPEAKELFKAFVDHYSKSGILKASGYAGLAACAEISKEYEDAAEFYEKACDLNKENSEAANYLYLSGLNFKQAGKMEKAKTAFARLVEEFPKSQQINNAKFHLTQING